MTSPLKDRLIAKIKAEGPLSVAEYMTICLLDPVQGYYPTRDPLGSEGDFITAPEISQMFGEVIGLWCIQSWQDMGRPETVQLIELGPGRGIMMSDILRATQLDKGFLAAVNVTLIEASPALEAVQGKTLGTAPCPISWAPSLEKAPTGPSIIITLQFGVSPAVISESLQATLPEEQEEAKNDELLELCPASAQIIDLLKQRFETDKGRALFIDYGPAETEFGDFRSGQYRPHRAGRFWRTNRTCQGRRATRRRARPAT